MMSLTFAIKRHFVIQRLERECRSDEAFGSFCMSRPPMKTNPHEYNHILCRWQRNPEKRKDLLSSCAALLCWDQAGKLMILSAPRLCLIENSTEDELFIIAQRGNALKRDAPIVSIPVEALCQSVIGYVPEVVPPPADSAIIDGANELTGLRSGAEVPAFKGTEAVKMARFPVMLPLPFGHDIDEDLTEAMVRMKLHVKHAYYSLWIESTGWLCQNLDAPELLRLTPTVHQKGSLPWTELFRELERVRNENLERFLDRNKEYYEVEGCAETLVGSSQNAPGIAASCHLEGQPSPTTDFNKDLAPAQAVSPAESESEAEGQQVENQAKVVFGPTTPVPCTTTSADPASLVPPMPRLQAASSLECDSGPENKCEKPELPSPPRLDSDPTGAHMDFPWALSSAATLLTPAFEQPTEELENHQPEVKKRTCPTLLEEIPIPAKKVKSWGNVETKILEAMSELVAINMQQPSRLLVAIFAGYANPDSKGIKDAMKHLKEENLVDVRKGGVVVVTDLGNTYLPSVNPPKSDAEVHKRILAGIQKKQQQAKKLKALFEELSDGGAHDIADVARRVGYTNVGSSGFKEARSALDDLRFLIHDKSKKTLQLKPFLFPFSKGSLTQNFVTI